MKQEMMGWQWHQLDHMQIISTLLLTYNHASISSLDFLQAGRRKPITHNKHINTARDVYRRPSFYLLHTQGTSKDIPHTTQSADKPAYYRTCLKQIQRTEYPCCIVVPSGQGWKKS